MNCPVCGVDAFVKQGACFVCHVCGYSYCEVDPFRKTTDGGEPWQERKGQQSQQIQKTSEKKSEK